MENRIAQALTKLFEHHRIVFWYDTKQELRDDFEALSLAGIEKIELANNEYGLKYRMLREEPEKKFLLYHDGPQPADLDNWLLDVQLAQGEFRADQGALWLSELGLGLEFAELVKEHTEFFQAVKRKDSLKKLLKSDDTTGLIRMKMLAVCAGSEPRIDSVVENLLQELADDREEKIKLISRCGLDEFLWKQLDRHYDYHSGEKSLKDFTLRIFQDCYEMEVDPDKYLEIRKKDREEKKPFTRMSQDVQVFLKRWKDSRLFEAGFEALSSECAEVLGIEEDLANRDFRELIEVDYFRLVDQKIISDLVKAVLLRTVSSGDVTLWIRQRRQSHWYREFQHIYEAIDHGAQFFQALNEADLAMESMADGIQRYCRFWFRLDQLYRKFVYHVGSSLEATLLGALAEQIENLYSTNYLLKVNNQWQPFVDTTAKWDVPSFVQQRNFFTTHVQPVLAKENKIFVIVSDAFRYEIGEEFLSRVRQEDRYDATLEPALSMLPSFTQLGMAALLPNNELEFVANDSGPVLVDGQSSQGTANRIKILVKAIPQRGTAIRAEELMKLNKEDSRALVRDHDIIYIYHNRIDATGDKRETEERVFVSVEETLQELIKLIKKLTGANATNIVVTSDHGFIYQHRPIEESDFSGVEVEGDQVLFRDRRFVIGKGLKDVAGLRKFYASDLGLSGDLEIQIPKSINRLRLKGSGSRFVHGGASLQEVIIPVLKINKKRQSDISAVEVDILRGASSTITSGQLAVTLYQAQQVTDKVHPRTLLAGIYNQDGELISDLHELTFDLTSENPRERELRVRFVLSRKADEANEQEVILQLKEKVPGTSYEKEYKSLRYVMRKKFTSDFDL